MKYQHKHPISVGIMAYNEESNIENVLDSLISQHLDTFELKEIFVISASTDKTDKIVKDKQQTYSNISLISEQERAGKYKSINLFLHRTQSNTLVLISADTCPHPNSLEILCTPLLQKDVGICGAQIIPQETSSSFMYSVIKLQWKLHHQISLIHPKFGEMIAFKKIFNQISRTVVDEEEIARKIISAGMKCKYVPEAIVNNCGPTDIAELFRQRQRIYCGHLELKKRTGHITPTLNNIFVLRVFLKNISLKSIHTDLVGVTVEIFARFCGMIDYATRNKKHYVWDIAKSTKHNLREQK